jgi:hypothetical protein
MRRDIACVTRMLQAAIQVVLYALLAGLSPLAVAATIAVTQAGRLKALGFGTGFVAAQLVTCTLFVIIGVTTTSSSTRSHHPGVQALLAFALALALGGVALQVRRRPPTQGKGSSNRTRAALERLRRLRFFTTVLAGLLLGIGGPKRLLLTAFAATTITSVGTSDSGKAAFVVLYVALATALVWGPVILFVLLGERGVKLMESAKGAVARHQPGVTVYTLLLIAALLAIDGIGVLVSQVF